MSAEDLVALLTAAGLTIATAESLTGGLVGAAITDVPGASAVYVGSVVSYATRVKASLLGVDAGRLAAHGAVDEEVARQMAEGACRVLDADLGLATTGVAGPDPQDGQPVGTVFVAVAWPARDLSRVTRLSLVGTREQVRRGSVDAVLALARQVLAEPAPEGGEERPGPGR